MISFFNLKKKRSFCELLSLTLFSVLCSIYHLQYKWYVSLGTRLSHLLHYDKASHEEHVLHQTKLDTLLTRTHTRLGVKGTHVIYMYKGSTVAVTG